TSRGEKHIFAGYQARDRRVPSGSLAQVSPAEIPGERSTLGVGLRGLQRCPGPEPPSPTHHGPVPMIRMAGWSAIRVISKSRSTAELGFVSMSRRAPMAFATDRRARAP